MPRTHKRTKFFYNDGDAIVVRYPGLPSDGKRATVIGHDHTLRLGANGEMPVRGVTFRFDDRPANKVNKFFLTLDRIQRIERTAEK